MYQADKHIRHTEVPAGPSVPTGEPHAQQAEITEQRRLAYERARREGLVIPMDGRLGG
ncbi:MAG: hypothetical protein OXU20_42500 [Myxococcales bacterium]|nr:hypothetical protein [Myxococcales bacterium]